MAKICPKVECYSPGKEQREKNDGSRNGFGRKTEKGRLVPVAKESKVP